MVVLDISFRVGRFWIEFKTWLKFSLKLVSLFKLDRSGNLKIGGLISWTIIFFIKFALCELPTFVTLYLILKLPSVLNVLSLFKNSFEIVVDKDMS